jgi:hypothetical protein
VPVPRRWLAGVFLVALSLLMLEVALTRIFSLIMWYYFAVLSISLALFGTAVGGICVYVYPEVFRRERLADLFRWTSLAYSVSTVVAFLVLLGVPVIPNPSVAGFLNLAIVYTDLAIPFFFGGLCLSLAISHLSARVSTVYFADLVGACAGCLLVIPALDRFRGPGTILLAAVLAALASLTFAPLRSLPRIRSFQLLWVVTVLGLFVVNHKLNLLQVQYVKGQVEGDKLYEGWNSFSRVAVFPEVRDGKPYGWGLSDRYLGGNPGWIRLNIDGMAETPISRFDEGWEQVRFLEYDVSSLANYLKAGANVLVIGPGGGRDVLSALLFGQDRVEGVELNPLVVQAVKGRFGEYAGRIYDDPRVRIFVDDGRNHVAKSGERYDIIQASAVDTWAATAAGAFALSENTLYTQEAFRTYYDHLSPDGVLTVSRFVYPFDRYGEALRLTGLALWSWRGAGVADPSQHLVVVGKLSGNEDEGYVSLIMKRSTFTLSEVEKLEAVSRDKGFAILFAPFGRGHGLIRDFVTAPDYVEFWNTYPIDISPPDDDRPFFFQMLRLTDLPRLGWSQIWTPSDGERLRLVPVATLGGLLVIVTVLTLAFVLGPMWRYKRDDLRGSHRSLPFILYFACLGTGFMMIEVGLMQKFVLLVGHPTYALALVLFAILLGSSVGSFLTRSVRPSRAAAVGGALGLVLIAALPLYIRLLPQLQSLYMGAPQETKVALAFAALFPVGLLLGTFFPLGIKQLSGAAEPLIPWCWAVNGATSVFASVFALAVGLQFGISAELMLGWAAYVVASGLLVVLALEGRLRDRVPAMDPAG